MSDDCYCSFGCLGREPDGLSLILPVSEGVDEGREKASIFSIRPVMVPIGTYLWGAAALPVRLQAVQRVTIIVAEPTSPSSTVYDAVTCSLLLSISPSGRSGRSVSSAVLCPRRCLSANAKCTLLVSARSLTARAPNRDSTFDSAFCPGCFNEPTTSSSRRSVIAKNERRSSRI